MQKTDRCLVFKVHFLGTVTVSANYGNKYIAFLMLLYNKSHPLLHQF